MQTTYTGLSQRTNVYAAVEMLAHAQPLAVLTKFGLTKPLPKNKAETMKFRRAVPFPKLTVALSEGVTPTSRVMQYEDVSVTLDEYGDVVETSDRVRELSEDPAIKDAAELLGEQAVETQESVCWGVVRAGSSVGYNNGTQRTHVNTPVSLNKLRAAVRTLRAQRAMMVAQVLDSSVKYNTKWVEAAFIAFCHTDVESDIRNLTGFTPTAQYGQRTLLCPQELGTVENIRFIISPALDAILAGGSSTLNGMKSVGGSAVDIYPIIIMGKDAYGHVPLKGAKSVETYVYTGGTKDDPLNQRDLVGAKYWYSAVRLNESWMYRLEVAVTSL
jgi:N4-gp56 family major capsid protein